MSFLHLDIKKPLNKEQVWLLQEWVALTLEYMKKIEKAEHPKK